MDKNEKIFGLGVFACIFNKDLSKILLLKRNKEKREKWGADWGNIGGKIEPGETSHEACLREAKEEINVNFNPDSIKMVSVKETPEFTDKVHAIHFIYCAILDESEKIEINSESENFKWFNIENLPESMLDEKEDIFEILDEYKKHL